MKVNLYRTRNKLTDLEGGLVVATGGRWGGGMNWEVGIGMCTLLYVK